MRANATKRGAGIAVFLISLYFTGTLEQTIYDANNFYKPMTNEYDVVHRGQVFLPPCMKQLFKCWELVKHELFCKFTRQYRQTLESICMDLRFQCTEFTGPQPFYTVNVSTWAYCPPTKVQMAQLDLQPISGLHEYSDRWWWERLKEIPKSKKYGLISGPRYD